MTTIIFCILLNVDKYGQDDGHWLSCTLDELSPVSSEDVDSLGNIVNTITNSSLEFTVYSLTIGSFL